MFDFFLKSSHSGLLEFCGSNINVESDPNSPDGKFCFRKYENGHNDWNVTRHSNILYHVVRGKKSFGLWVKQWSEGIAECSFTKEEIIKEFKDRDLVIPKGLMKSFDDSIQKEKQKRYDRYLRELERAK
jgi:hypothetical protein|tara:strand:- start:5356 stop:5742 length:387 start_codon:yes stop_codon:yes gene_type:complete